MTKNLINKGKLFLGNICTESFWATIH